MATEVFSVPASTSLLSEVDKLAPGRRKTQDGTIGDRAHMGRASDHNLDEIGNTGASSDPDKIPEVHARDIDARGPWPAGWSMMRIVLLIVARCVAGTEKRLKYIIFDGWIWSASSGWARKKYDEADQHREHGHFSFKYGSGSGTSNPENITSPWGILAAYEQEQDMPLSDDEIDKIAKAVWNFQVENPYITSGSKMQPAQTPLRYAPSLSPHTTTHSKVDTVAGNVAKILTIVTDLSGKDFTDEAAIIQGVLAGLVGADGAADTIADAVVAALPEDLATDVANQILAKQGQAMLDAAEGE